MEAYPSFLPPVVALRGARAMLRSCYARRVRALVGGDAEAVARLEERIVRYELLVARHEAVEHRRQTTEA